jgi:dihydroflavonol-4-reductase
VSLVDKVGHYARTKFMAEQVARELAGAGVPVVIVNPSVPIGAGDHKPTPTGQMIVDYLNGRLPGYVNTGLNIVDVEDVAAGHLLAAERGRVGERYILGGENMTLRQLYQTIADVVGCGMKLKAMPRWLVAITAGLTDMLQPQTSVPVPLTGARLRLESQMFYFDASKARQAFDMPKTPLRITIGRTYVWYDLMGEFAGVHDRLLADGDVCKYCGQTRYCEWPPQISAQ